MYYIVYAVLRFLSILPLSVLYVLSDGIYLLVVYVFGYRKKVVLNNLQIAFPEKTEAERIRIMKDFYHNFCDTVIETIKLLSWSEKEILKHIQGNIEVINAFAGKEQSLQVMSGHFFNWEIANVGVSAVCKLPFIGVYMPISNKILNRIFYQMRQKTGTILISATDFKNEVGDYLQQQYALILVGDQNPGNPSNAYWLNFFSKPAPFVKGPERGARMNNTAVLYLDFYKVKRGYYRYQIDVITTTPAALKEGELTRLLVKKVEDSIRLRPANYLWSHRRWKHQWKEEYRELFIG